jgi:hypothetical protein
MVEPSQGGSPRRRRWSTGQTQTDVTSGGTRDSYDRKCCPAARGCRREDSVGDGICRGHGHRITLLAARRRASSRGARRTRLRYLGPLGFAKGDWRIYRQIRGSQAPLRSASRSARNRCTLDRRRLT